MFHKKTKKRLKTKHKTQINKKTNQQRSCRGNREY